jgi:precorrin-6B methylase 2
LKFLPIVFGLACFAVNAEEGARTPPFITTPDEVVERMLELAGTHRGDLVVDLGSGDGRIVIAAARRFGARGLGIELDARLVERSRDEARRAQVADRVAFVHGDVLVSDISQASVVTVYLLPGLIDRLQPRFLGELEPGTRIVSHAFSMVGWKPDRVETVRLTQPHPGQGDESTLYLWIVPAEVRGLWHGAGSQLKIHQNYQEIEIEGATRASLSGRDISWEADGANFRGRVEGDRISGELERNGRARPLVLKRLR